MKQKILTMILLAGLTISMLAGCGQTEDASTADTQTEESTTQPEATEQVEEVATETPETEVASLEEPEASTQEATPEPTEEPEPTITPETEPTEEPEPTITPETETTEEPKPEYTYTELNKTMYASSAVNLRDLPSTDGAKVGGLNRAEEVTVLAQCNETQWYKISYNGSEVFVSNSYLVDEKPAEEIAEASNNNSSTTSNVPNPYEVPISTWVDLGDWFLYIDPSLGCPDNVVNSPFWENQRAILQERYPDRHISGRSGINLDNGAWSAWMIAVGGTNSYDYPQALLDFIAKYQYHY